MAASAGSVFGGFAGFAATAIFSNISGKGHSGYHEGHLMFNDTSSLQMVLTVVPEEKVELILSGLKPFLERHSGSLFVLDASVLRPSHFESAEP